jgi:hypothetical protein
MDWRGMWFNYVATRLFSTGQPKLLAVTVVQGRFSLPLLQLACMCSLLPPCSTLTPAANVTRKWQAVCGLVLRIGIVCGANHIAMRLLSTGQPKLLAVTVLQGGVSLRLLQLVCMFSLLPPCSTLLPATAALARSSTPSLCVGGGRGMWCRHMTMRWQQWDQPWLLIRAVVDRVAQPAPAAAYLHAFRAAPLLHPHTSS